MVYGVVVPGVRTVVVHRGMGPGTTNPLILRHFRQKLTISAKKLTFRQNRHFGKTDISDFLTFLTLSGTGLCPVQSSGGSSGGSSAGSVVFGVSKAVVFGVSKSGGFGESKSGHWQKSLTNPYGECQNRQNTTF